MSFLRKIIAFIKKGFITQKNYPLAFFMSMFHIVFIIAIFYFLGKLLGQNQALPLAGYKGDLFTFLLIGLAFSSFLEIWLNCFSNSLQREFYNGSLESMLLTPTGIFQILFCFSLWPHAYAILQVLLYFIIGSLLFGAGISNAGCIPAFLVMLVSLFIFTGIGIISASLLMVFKRGDLLKEIFYYSSLFLGGVYFPIEVLPQSLKKVSVFLPVTYSLRALRNVLINGCSIGVIYNDLKVLFLFAIVLFPLSLFIFKRAFMYAKAAGSLTHY